MNNFLKFLYWVVGKSYEEEVPDYPNQFAIIDFSPIAKENGITDNQNKVIYRYISNEGRIFLLKKYRYSLARVNSLKEIYKIPIFDKTRIKQVLPMYGKVYLSEVRYTR